MKHNFSFSDSECLIISYALNYLIKDEERHPIDRQDAKKIKDKILKTVIKDLESNNETDN